MIISNRFSIYLNSIRFLAALFVMFQHIGSYWGSQNIFYYLRYFGSDAVMVFFILSGYVISWVSDTKDNSFKSFAISRISRFYSVIPVVLIIVLTLDILGNHLNISFYPVRFQLADTTHVFLQGIISLLLIGQTWFHSIPAFSDSPWWSIGYEFWYYFLFAFMFYFKGNTRILFVILLSILIGPKILLYPVWLFGCLIYILHKKNSLSKICYKYITLLWILTIIAYLIFRMHNLDLYKLSSKWAFSASFINDYIVGIIFGLNLFFAKYLVERFPYSIPSLSMLFKYFSKGANFSFVLYLVHFPLLLFIASFFHISIQGNNVSSISVFLMIVTVILISYLLSFITEKNKKPMKIFLNAIFKKGIKQ